MKHVAEPLVSLRAPGPRLRAQEPRSQIPELPVCHGISIQASHAFTVPRILLARVRERHEYSHVSISNVHEDGAAPLGGRQDPVQGVLGATKGRTGDARPAPHVRQQRQLGDYVSRCDERVSQTTMQLVQCVDSVSDLPQRVLHDVDEIRIPLVQTHAFHDPLALLHAQFVDHQIAQLLGRSDGDLVGGRFEPPPPLHVPTPVLPLQIDGRLRFPLEHASKMRIVLQDESVHVIWVVHVLHISPLLQRVECFDSDGDILRWMDASCFDEPLDHFQTLVEVVGTAVLVVNMEYVEDDQRAVRVNPLTVEEGVESSSGYGFFPTCAVAATGSYCWSGPKKKSCPRCM